MVLALTGAQAQAEVVGPESVRSAPLCAPFVLMEGETLTLRAPTRGLRSIVAVRGDRR
ncbi:hypothetical protein [Nesterenkonia pannonica]|uniref:hypothetical protein n=1 Tax=Nesterenkonia pannonica TaxID=1548602 RepID=UPI0021648991|nr:hypothetical protein [Nesterenkonia pannonica]